MQTVRHTLATVAIAGWLHLLAPRRRLTADERKMSSQNASVAVQARSDAGSALPLAQAVGGAGKLGRAAISGAPQARRSPCAGSRPIRLSGEHVRRVRSRL